MGYGTQAVLRIADASEVEQARVCGTVFSRGSRGKWGLRLSQSDAEAVRAGRTTVQACRRSGEVVLQEIEAIVEDEGHDSAGRPWARLSSNPTNRVVPHDTSGGFKGWTLPSGRYIGSMDDVRKLWSDRCEELREAGAQVHQWAREDHEEFLQQQS